MPKFYYIVNVRMPTEKAHGIQMAQMCEALALASLQRSGRWNLELVVPRRLNSIKKDPFDYYGIERVFKLRKLPCLDLIPSDKLLGPLALWVTSFTFLFSVLCCLFFRKTDIIYTRDKFLLPLSWLSKNVFYEIHDFPAGFPLFYKIFFKHLAGIVVTNNWKKQELMKRFNVKEAKILVAFNGVDIDEFDVAETKEECREKLGIAQDKKIILYAGHLYDWKGAGTLLKAAHHLSFINDHSSTINNKLLFIFVGGTAKDIESFRSQVVGLKLNNVLVAGHREHSEIPLWLRAADVLVLPNTGKQDISKYYSSPLKMFEYMASKTPIVASDLPSIREILNEQNALLVVSDNHQALAQGIERVLQNTDLAVKISEQAFEDVQNYTWQKRAEKILFHISKLAKV